MLECSSFCYDLIQQVTRELKLSLKVRAIRSAFWFALATASNNLLFFLVTLVLAHLLTPNDFGLVAISNFIVFTFGILQNMGLSQALIYKSDSLERVTATTFILAIGLGVLTFFIAVFSAPLVAVLFNEPQATPLAQVYAIFLIISSFGIVPEAILIAQLDFRRKFISDVLPAVIYVFISIALAKIGYGAWSIVIGRLVEAHIRVALIWYLTKWQISFQFEWSIAKDLLLYGKDIAISSTLAIVFLNIDNIFVSRMLNTSQLGYYTFAFSLATLPALFAQRVVDTVSFPTYTQLKEQQEILITAYLKSLTIVSILVLPINLGLLAIAPVLIPVLYGDKWYPAVPLLQILSLYGLIRALANVPTTVLLAIGKQYLFPRFNLMYVTIAALLLGPAIYLGGTSGAAIAMTVVIGAGALTWTLFANRYLAIPSLKIARVITPPGIAAVLMVIIVQAGVYSLHKSIYTLGILVIIGGLTYVGVLILATKGKAIDDAHEIIQPILPKNRPN